MSEVATLRVQKEQLKARLSKAEASLRASETREFELRNEEATRIDKAVSLKIRSYELKSNAVDSTCKRAQKDVHRLKVELSETHATFKQKLQIERDLKFRAIDELESLRATIQTMKKHNNLYAKRTRSLEAENERAVQEANGKAQQNIVEIQQLLQNRDEEVKTHIETAKEEREARFEAETKRRNAERIAKRYKQAATKATEELTTIKSKIDALQSRLDRATRGQRSALQSAKEAKSKNLMSLESTQKKLADKDMEINRLLASKKSAIDSALTLRKELERRVRELESRIDTDRQAFQTERSSWSQLEKERDTARENLSKQIEIGERCVRKVEETEETSRMLQNQLGKEKLKRLDVERKIAKKSLNETENERSRVEMSMQLRARNKEMREIKQALESRGISLEFLIGKTIDTQDSPVVIRSTTSMTKSLRHLRDSAISLRDSAEAMSPSSDFTSPPRSNVFNTTNTTNSSNSNIVVSPTTSTTSSKVRKSHNRNSIGSITNSMEHISAPNSCNSPKNVGTTHVSKLGHSTDSDKSSLGGSISVDASLSQWKKKVEGAASGALWGVRRQTKNELTPSPKKKSRNKKKSVPTRVMNPAAAAALRRQNQRTTIIKEL